MGEWRYRPLGEMIESLDARRKPVKEADRKPGPYPYYGASGIVDYVDSYLFDGLHLLIAEDGENLRTRKLPIAFLADGRFWVNNHAHVVRGNRHGDTRFLSYALMVADVGSYLSGSTMPKLTQANLHQVPIYAPGIEEQAAIARVLGSLEDKIALNRRMNETLEEMAQAIFRDWFVDFGPVRRKLAGATGAVEIMGRMTTDGVRAAKLADLFPVSFGDDGMPAGWRLEPLGTIAQVVDCLHAKKPSRTAVGRPYLQLNNIADLGMIDESDTYLVSEADYAMWTSRIEASPGDCVITNVGRVGAVAQIPAGMYAALGRNMTAIRCKAEYPYPAYLITCLLSRSMRREIESQTDTGTILDALNVKSIPKLRICNAAPEVLRAFEDLARSLRDMMEGNAAQARKLVETRDYLLPRLMSGQVTVREAVQEIAA